MATVADSIARLRTTGEHLPRELRDAIRADGVACVSALIEIVDDDALALVSAPGKGFAPIHAVELLADIKAPEAVGPMLQALLRGDWQAILHDRLVARLPDFGAAVIEPALAMLATTNDAEQRHSICAVLAKAGVRDERVFEAIRSVFDEDATFGVMLFADYGDPRALPLIERRLETLKPDLDPLFGSAEVNELVAAYEDLGGELPEHLQVKTDAWFAKADAKRHELFAQPAAPTARAKVGRNDPRPCGSGKKFKKCCIGKEAS